MRNKLKTTLKLEFKLFTFDETKVVEGVALLTSGEIVVIGKYNDLGGVCDCCPGINPEKDIIALAEIDPSKLAIVDQLKVLAKNRQCHLPD